MLELLMNYLGKGRSKLLLQTEDKTGRRPLHIAAYKCDETIVQYLTKKCAEYEVDMAKKDSAGNTAGSLAGKTNRRKSREIIESYIPTEPPKAS
jgi:ankyrin repeat protein